MNYETLPRIIRRYAQSDPERLFLQTVHGEEITYGQSHGMSMRWAALYESIGVRAGHTVCEMLPNLPVAIHSWMGISWLGAVEVPLNTAYRGNLLVHTIEDSLAEVLCIGQEYLEQLREVAGSLTRLRTVVVPDLEDDAYAADLPFTVIAAVPVLEAQAEPVHPVEPVATDLACILYTSGTTGPSKGVMVSWAQLEETSTHVMPFEPLEISYSALPLYHVTAKIYGAYLPALSGGRAVLRESFKTGEFWSDVRKFGCTTTAMVGSIPTFLWREPAGGRDSQNPLERVIMVPLIPEVHDMQDRFGIKVHTVFNMTETSIPLTSEPFNLVDSRSVGKIRPGYEARIVDVLDRELPTGSVGELVLRTEQPWLLNQGYWRRPEATVEAWRNLWFHTGDAFRSDTDGNFYFVDRMKDTIRRRGENISSFEIEQEIDSHESAFESAVVGVPSEYGEEDVKAFVVLKPGAELEPIDLHTYLRGRLPKFMLPRYIAIVDELPKTPTLKVRKVALREMSSTSDTWDATHPE